MPIRSTATGAWLTGTELDGGYWYRNLRGTVDLHGAVRALAERGHDTFVEISPHPVLIGAIADTLGGRAIAIGTLRLLFMGKLLPPATAAAPTPVVAAAKGP